MANGPAVLSCTVYAVPEVPFGVKNACVVVDRRLGAAGLWWGMAATSALQGAVLAGVVGCMTGRARRRARCGWCARNQAATAAAEGYGRVLLPCMSNVQEVSLGWMK